MQTKTEELEATHTVAGVNYYTTANCIVTFDEESEGPLGVLDLVRSTRIEDVVTTLADGFDETPVTDTVVCAHAHDLMADIAHDKYGI